MVQRRLTDQQQRRIERQLEERRKDHTGNDRQPGLVISHHGKILVVEDHDGNRYRCSTRQNIGQPVCGDFVAWEAIDDESGVIKAIHDRDSLLVRPGFADRLKAVAANITRMCIIIAPEPQPQELLIDSYLVAAEHMGIKAVIVGNKADLMNTVQQRAWQQRFAPYQALGYKLLSTSCRQKNGLEELLSVLEDNVSILVGQSGVGKSSLIKALLPDRDTQVAELSDGIMKGRHTTSYSEYYRLPDRPGAIIDSPGVRDFRLGHLEPAEIESGYIEFRAYLGTCKFSDCRHDKEPGCAIRQAVQNGKIPAGRLERFHMLLEQN